MQRNLASIRQGLSRYDSISRGITRILSRTATITCNNAKIQNINSDVVLTAPSSNTNIDPQTRCETNQFSRRTVAKSFLVQECTSSSAAPLLSFNRKHFVASMFHAANPIAHARFFHTTTAISAAAPSTNVQKKAAKPVSEQQTEQQAAAAAVRKPKTTFQSLGLMEPILRALKAMKIKKPTEIQKLCINEIMKGKDALLAAQTGTGKTLAYLLPLLHRMKQEEIKSGRSTRESRPKMLIIVPSRELALQIIKVVKAIGHELKIASTVLCGGKKESIQRKALEGKVDVVVTTTGRFLLHREKGRVFYTDVTYVVVDEADTMLQKDFKDELEKILIPCKDIETNQDRKVQFVFALATMNNEVQDYIAKEFPRMVTIQTSNLHRPLPNIKQNFIPITAGQDKLDELEAILQQAALESGRAVVDPIGDGDEESAEVDYEEEDEVVSQQTGDSADPAPAAARAKKGNKKREEEAQQPADRTMVFCNTVSSCRAVHHHLVEKGYKAACYHSEMPGDLRDQNFKTFLNGDSNIIVCTDVASRGLDTLRVSHVINFDFPLNVVDYQHRIGRTGRMGRPGRVTSLLVKRDMVLANAIQDAIQHRKSLHGLSSDKTQYNPSVAPIARSATITKAPKEFSTSRAKREASTLRGYGAGPKKRDAAPSGAAAGGGRGRIGSRKLKTETLRSRSSSAPAAARSTSASRAGGRGGKGGDRKEEKRGRERERGGRGSAKRSSSSSSSSSSRFSSKK